MERIYYLLKQSLFVKLALVATLVIGGGNSVWAQKSLPYSYGFENNDLAGEGWTKSCETIVVSGESDGGGIYNSNSYKGYENSKYTYRFYGNTVYQYLISPLLATSQTGIDVSFYYNSFTGTQSRTFNVGYSTSDNSISSFVWLDEDVTYTEDGWIKFGDSFPLETKYVAIRHKAVSQYQPFFIDNILVEPSELYKKPKNLTVSSFSSTYATLSWTAGRDEGAWQIAYSTKDNFNPDTEGVKVDVTENPYTLNGLAEGVTYYAYVRSNYSGNFSAWSNVISFQLQKDYILNSDASSTNANIPIPNYTNNSGYLTKSQIIIPYSELSDVKGNYITQLIFYANSSTIDWGTATYDVYLAETTTSYFAYSATFIDWENCTKVMEDTKLSVSDSKLKLNLSTPFLYLGNDNKNLLIGFQQKTTSASSVSSSWISSFKTPGSSKYYCAAYYFNGSYTYSTGQSYVPKMTITTLSSTISATLGTNGYTTFACPRPLNLSALPEGLKAYKAAVEGDKVKFTEISQAVPANTGVLLAGEASETYDIPFADSGTEPEGNEFLVNSVGGTFTAVDGYTYYGLIKNTLTFGTFAPGSVAIPTNKAYLKVANTPTGEARVLTCSFFDETTTGIMETRTEGIDRLTTTKVYNLAGQQIANPTKGLYIINGKKHIIK